MLKMTRVINKLTPGTTPAHMRYSVPRGMGIHRTLEQVEAEHIRNVLAGTENNKTKAAEILGIDRKTLRSKLKKIKSPD